LPIRLANIYAGGILDPFCGSGEMLVANFEIFCQGRERRLLWRYSEVLVSDSDGNASNKSFNRWSFFALLMIRL
jgi:hypothetical protein